MGAIIEVTQPERAPLHILVVAHLEVGRECNGLLVADQRVSRRHLRLELVADQVVVADLGSSNGTFVDGSRLRAPAVFEPGSTLTLGSTSIRLLGVGIDVPDTQAERDRFSANARLSPDAAPRPADPTTPSTDSTVSAATQA